MLPFINCGCFSGGASTSPTDIMFAKANISRLRCKHFICVSKFHAPKVHFTARSAPPLPYESSMRSRIVYHPQRVAVYHQRCALYIINFGEIVYHQGGCLACLRSPQANIAARSAQYPLSPALRELSPTESLLTAQFKSAFREHQGAPLRISCSNKRTFHACGASISFA